MSQITTNKTKVLFILFGIFGLAMAIYVNF